MFLKSLAKRIILILVMFSFACSSPKEGPKAFKEQALQKTLENYKSVCSHYEELIKENPSDQSIKISLAQFYHDFRDYQKAKEILFGIETQAAKELLAKVLVKLKDYDHAIEIYEKLKDDSSDPEYFYLYGKLLEEKNLFPKALKIYQKVNDPFRELAQKRIQAIKTKKEFGIPDAIATLSNEAKDFVAELNDDAAVTLLVDEEISIKDDNTSVSTIHVVEKILKERGKKLAEVEIGYDSTYERVELEFARTITKDKETIYAGAENARDVSRYLNYPLYSNSRVFIISMPSVDVGAFIEYKIKIYSSKLVADDKFSFIYRLREEDPIFKARFKLISPKAQKVFFKFINQEYAKGINLNPKITKENDKAIYFWKFDKINPIIPEPYMPPTSFVNPAVLISNFSSWEQVYKWWYSLYQDKMSLDDSAKGLVQELIKGSSSNFDKAKKIHEYVAKNIRYVAIEYGDSGHEPHAANEVLINRYGDCKDQAILLVSMLREANLEAYPVLIPTRSAYPVFKDFASLNFNHAIAAVKINDDLIFMDPTAETIGFGKIPLSDQERPVMVFYDDSWQILYTELDKKNEVIYDMVIDVDLKENSLVERSILTSGFFASSYRWYIKYTHPDKVLEDIQKKMRQISTFSELIEHEIKGIDDFDINPVLSYKFRADKFFNPAGNLRIISSLDQLDFDPKLTSKQKRNFPIDLEALFSKTAKVRIKIPSSFKIKYLPKSFVLDNLWFKLGIEYGSRPDSIDFYQNLDIKKRFVGVAEYEEFKQQLQKAMYILREEIILEKVR